MEHKPFYSVNQYYRELFGDKVYKISLNAGMTCPNRDGTIDTRGCIFCSAGGSGDFAADPHTSITSQIDSGIRLVSSKYKGGKYIAYFQAFTNTYAPVDRLRNIFYCAVRDPRIVGLSVATRPDCLEPEKIELLTEINRLKPVWVELGLQTIDEAAAQYIRRGYPLSVYEDALTRLKAACLPVVTHIIVGLPHVTHESHTACAKYLAGLHPHGVKLQLLHVLKGTDLADEYASGKFEILSAEEYVSAIVDMIELLPEDMVIYRITGDGPRKLLIAPMWSTDKKKILNSVSREFRLRNTYQGKRYRNGC